jgi:hypothetical protein
MKYEPVSTIALATISKFQPFSFTFRNVLIELHENSFNSIPKTKDPSKNKKIMELERKLICYKDRILFKHYILINHKLTYQLQGIVTKHVEKERQERWTLHHGNSAVSSGACALSLSYQPLDRHRHSGC